MTRPAATPRPGFTLVELLVGMAVIVALAAIALVVVPDVMTQDRTTDGAGTVRQTFMIARARAQRDRAPRGVRFLVGSDPTNLVKYNAGPTGQLWVTELQYIERPTPLEPNPNGVGDPSFPHVEVVLDTVKTGPNAGTIDFPTYPQLVFRNLPGFTSVDPNVGTRFADPDVRALVNADIADKYIPILSLPAFGMTLDLVSTEADGRFTVPLAVGGNDFQIAVPQLDQERLMAALGAGLGKVDYRPQIVLRPRPLLGEPTVQLPRNVCVDLSVSLPASPATPLRDLDIVFRPGGQVDTAGGLPEQIMLWVRDYTKTPNPLVQTSAGPPAVFDLVPFQTGGEQQVVSLKARSGSLGVFPVLWPQAGGTYTAGEDPFSFARKAAQ